jgi:hypothetical protein
MAEQTTKNVPLKWSGIEEEPIYFCNAFLLQNIQNEFVLTLGYANPPTFLNPPTQTEIDAIDSVDARPVMRVGLTPDRLIELIGILEINLRNYQGKTPE